jgi:NAD(P)-dependent dehydrogenase (short-subunit alcohol dehydrogenase family)
MKTAQRTAMVWGASGGIGAALVKHLVDEGWAVLSVARDPGSVTYLTSEVVAADVEDPDSVRRAVERAGALVEEVDLWIYAIGDIASVKIDKMSLGDWERILAANLTGPYLAAHHSLPLLASDAHMVFLGAVSERLRLPGLGAYASAKAGLEAFVDVLRKEQRGRHVTVVRPKAVETELWGKVPFSVPHGAMKPADLAERVLQAYEEEHSGVLNL